MSVVLATFVVVAAVRAEVALPKSLETAKAAVAKVAAEQAAAEQVAAAKAAAAKAAVEKTAGADAVTKGAAAARAAAEEALAAASEADRPALQKTLDNQTAAVEAAADKANAAKVAADKAAAESLAAQNEVAQTAAAYVRAHDQEAATYAAAPGGLKPLPSSAWDHGKARHLLVRAGFGGTPDEVQRLYEMGLHNAVDYLVNIYDRPQAHIEFDVMRLQRPEPRGSPPADGRAYRPEQPPHQPRTPTTG